MAEVDLGGGPIFVDVDTGQQYPISDFPQTLIQAPPSADTQATQTLQVIEIDADREEESQQGLNEEKPVKEVTAPSDNACLTIQHRRIRCPECHRYTAETEEKMLRHIRKVHRGENPFQCYMCDYSTYNKSLFEEHVRIHQGIKPYKCSQCPYRSVSKKNTKKHELIHRPDNPLKCSECDFIARHPRALICHRKIHEDSVNKASHYSSGVKKEEKSTGKVLVCKECPFKYRKPEQLRAHKKDRRKCKQCDYVACTRTRLNVHMANEHNLQYVKSKLFNCSLCKWSSSNKPRILLHLIHHPKQTVDQSIVDTKILKKLGIMD